MDAARRKRLIEVAFPLEEVSEDARRDAYRGSPHPQTLHRWWARRPLSACRAFIYASLVDDPTTDAEREELLKEVADLANWNAIRHPEKIVRKKVGGWQRTYRYRVAGAGTMPNPGLQRWQAAHAARPVRRR